MLLRLALVGLLPDPPDSDDHEQRRRDENSQEPQPGTAQPDDQPAKPRHDYPNLPGGGAVQPRGPGIARVVCIALRADDGVLAAAKNLDDAVRLDVMVADRDVKADHLADADIPSRLRRHDHHVPSVEVRPHASGQNRLRAVEAGVRNQSKRREGHEGESEYQLDAEIGCDPYRADDSYLSVPARCVPVNVYWIVDDLFWNELPAPLGKVSVTRR